MRIYKYPIVPDVKVQEIELPVGSEFLSVVAQGNQIMLYCTVINPDSNDMQLHRYMVVGTGWDLFPPVDDTMKFINTVVIGVYVWHVFKIATA